MTERDTGEEDKEEKESEVKRRTRENGDGSEIWG